MVTLKGLLDRTQVRPALCLCLGVLLYAPPSDSQELQFRATDAGPAFDVTSIKVAPGDTPFEGIKSLPGGLVRTRRTTAYDLILAAFGINRNRLVSQFPDWLTQESYSVEARATNQAVLTREEVGARLRSMLADRFHLQVRYEDRQGLFFALARANGGGRLAPAPSDETTSLTIKVKAQTEDPDHPGQHLISSRTFTATAVSMPYLAQRLDATSEIPIVDETGIEGAFSFAFDVDGEYSPTSPGISGLNAALQRSVGLKLEARHGPIKMLVVDHIERPTEN